MTHRLSLFIFYPLQFWERNSFQNDSRIIRKVLLNVNFELMLMPSRSSSSLSRQRKFRKYRCPFWFRFILSINRYILRTKIGSYENPENLLLPDLCYQETCRCCRWMVSAFPWIINKIVTLSFPKGFRWLSYA